LPLNVAAVSSLWIPSQRPWRPCYHLDVKVAGDLNETYDKQAVQTLLKASDLRDAASGSDTPTYPADNPQHRIDYLLYSSCFSAANVTVLDSLASDHRPLIAEFDVRK